MLNKLPKAAQPKANQALNEIWMAEIREEVAFDLFVKKYEDKYPGSVQCLLKDLDALISFYEFPNKHWISIRTTNPIESCFATIRHRAKRSKGCLSRSGIHHMVLKPGQCAQKRWHRLRGFDQLAKVIEGVKFKDGMEVTNDDQIAA